MFKYVNTLLDCNNGANLCEFGFCLINTGIKVKLSPFKSSENFIVGRYALL